VSGNVSDVAIVGAGVVGCAVARELTRSGLNCILIDAANDVGTGTSKANTAILHTGFDAPIGSTEATLVARGHTLLRRYAKRVGIATEELGALMIAWDDNQADRLPEIIERAEQNGHRAIRSIGKGELRVLEPELAEGSVAALSIPGESIICPWSATLALATEAVQGGCELRLSCRVDALSHGTDHHLIQTSSGVVRSNWLVNAAGLGSDEIHRYAGYDSFRIQPRRGELVIFDKLARGLVNHILLPVPTERTKGVLVTPTVYGNILVGPTAEDVPDKTATESTAKGLTSLLNAAQSIVPALGRYEVTAAFAGIRAATSSRDYQLGVDRESRYAWLAGIRSTGVSASLALAEWLREQLNAAGLELRDTQLESDLTMPPLGERQPRPFASAEAIARDPECGRLACFCERVSHAEVVASLHATIPARDLHGVRRRTRATMGRCQGFFCEAGLIAMLEAENSP
jgi:glycerol-3-phosphate dehydrogenase